MLEVLASQQALDAFSLTADPLQAQSKLRFAGRFLGESFTTTEPIERVEGNPITVRASSAETGDVSTVAMTPFVCAQDPSFAQKTQTGWQATETLQAYLQPDGVVNPENEFDRQLVHRCDWLAPGGDGGEGLATADRSPSLCSESDRTGTVLQIADVSDPSAARPLGTTTCKAYHYNRTAAPDVQGVIQDQIGIATTDGIARELVLSHCWSGAETFPSQIAVGGPTGTCPDEMMAIVTDGSSSSPIQASGGTWTLSNGPSLPGGGHEMADVDLTFGVSGAGMPAFTVRGHIDLPIVKVSVN